MGKNITSEQRWLAFAVKLPPVGYSILNEAQAPITEKGAADPKVIAITLLIRTISNFTAAITLMREGMVVEARVLVRCCYENLFWIACLRDDGDKFVKEMFRDEVQSKNARAEFLFGNFSGLDDDVKAKLRTHLREINEKAQHPKSLNPKEVALKGVLDKGYLAYSQLSADAAHPSVTALGRYITWIEENDRMVRAFDVNPVPVKGEAADTLSLACNAMIGVCIGVNEILGGTPPGQELGKIANEYQTLNGVG